MPHVQTNKVQQLQSFLEEKEQELEAEYLTYHKDTLAETFGEDITQEGGFALYWELLTMDIQNEWEDIMFNTGQIAAIRQLRHLLEE